MSLQKTLATFGGDIWSSWNLLAIWPYPAIVWGFHRGEFTWDDFACFCATIKPGDIILTRSNPYLLSNAAIAHTAFKHAAIYIGAAMCARDKKTGFLEGVRPVNGTVRTWRMASQRDRVVVHAISEGVVAQDLGEVLFHADAACVVRFWKTPEEQNTIVKTAVDMLGRPYDFEFDMGGSDCIFCTELAWMGLDAAGILTDPKRAHPPLSHITVSLLGRKADVPLADGFVMTGQPVCCSVSALERSFVEESAQPQVLWEALRQMPNCRDGY